MITKKIKNTKITKPKNCKPKKYNLGALVENNPDVFSGLNNQMVNLRAQNPGKGLAGKAAMSGMSAGSSLGSAVGSVVGSAIPGLGTLIGAGVGALGGAIFGGIQRKKARKEHANQIDQLDKTRSQTVQDMYEASVDTNNENPYGVYKNGGSVFPNIDPVINIEKGELQVDANTGKILRKYTGINPETGGLYEPHAKKGKDTDNNLVTAKEGTFIITKKEAKKYEDAVKNNDKLYQNSIMSNIRNHKKSVSKKYNDGGNVLGGLTERGLSGLSNPNLSINPNMQLVNPFNPNTSANINPGFDFGNAISTGLNFVPSIYNMIQGSKSPNFMPFNSNRMNVANRQRILANMPNEISANPALRNIRNARSRYNRNIDRNTSNASIARANRLSAESSFMGAENEALYNNALVNNQIRSQRANILSNLDAQDRDLDARNLANLNNTLMTNRQMSEGRRQQFDYGISQAGQMLGALRKNRDMSNMDKYRMDILREIFPVMGSYYSNLLRGGRNG